MTGFHSAAAGGTFWPQPVPILVVASPQDDTGPAPRDAVLTKTCLLPTLLEAASRLLLRGVLPAPSGLPEAPPA